MDDRDGGPTQSGPPPSERTTTTGTGSDLSSPGGAAPSGSPFDASRRVGRHLIVEEVGRGGMGVVYRAIDTSLDRPVAIKMLLDPERSASVEVARLQREAQAIARLRHPAIVTIHEVGEHLPPGGRAPLPYIVMDFVEGETLDATLARGRVPPRQAAEIVREVALGLDHAHRAGIVHRDVKPGNILLDREGRPRLVDFGLARSAGGAARITQTGAFVGTPGYAAPEQASGQASRIGPGSDVFSLGALLYRAIAGRPAFEGETLVQVLFAVMRHDPEPPGRIDPTVHRDLETIAMKCLEKEPAARYPTAASLADDLGRFLDGEAIAARPPGRAERARRWARGNPVLAGLASALLVVVVGALVAGAGLVRARSRERARYEQMLQERLEEAERQRAIALEQGRLADDRRAEADARRLAADRTLARFFLERSVRDKAAGRFRTAAIYAAHALALHDAPENRMALFGARSGPWRAPLVLRHGRPVTFVAFSPDGARVAATSDDETVRVWDARTGSPLAVLEGHESSVQGVAWSPDGRRLASAGNDATVRLWDAETGRLLATVRDHASVVRAVAFSPDGTRLASASEDGTARLRDGLTGASLAVLAGHRAQVEAVAFHPGGARLVTGSRDGTVREWDATTGATHGPPRTGHREAVRGVAFSPDGSVLASASWDGTVRLWDASAPASAAVATLSGHETMVDSVAFSPDGRSLASGGRDRTARLWDVSTGRAVAVFDEHDAPVGGVAFSPDGARLATASWDGSVRIWSTRASEPFTALRGHDGAVASVAFSPDGRRLVSGGREGALRLWDTDGARALAAAPGAHPGGVTSAAFSPDGELVASAGRDGAVRLFEPGEGELSAIASLAGHRDTVMKIRFSPDGRRLASASRDGTIRVWDVAARRPLVVIDGTHNQVWSVAWSPDGRTLAAGSADWIVRLWDPADGRQLARWEGFHGNAVGDLAFSPDGRRLATACMDWAVRLFDVPPAGSQPAPAAKLAGHRGFAHALAFSPDGARLASASEDLTVRLWDVARARPLGALTGHRGGVLAIDWSPDGLYLASGSADGLVALWTTAAALEGEDPRELLREVEQQTGLVIPQEALDPVPLVR